MTETKKLNYPTSLLKIESGQQFKKGRVSILDRDLKYQKVLHTKVNQKIDNVIKLNQKADGLSYTIELPEELRSRVNPEIKNQAVKELTAYEVRTLTAIVKLAEIARLSGELYPIERIRRNYFETNIKKIYEAMGAVKGRNNKDVRYIKNSILSLHRKEFIYYENEEFVFGSLVQVHGMRPDDEDIWKSTLKITIAACFNYQTSEDKTYFTVPFDLNQRLRKVTVGRPNASVEILVKYLYQSKHCSNANKVEYSFSKLSSIMNLKKYVKNRNYPRIRKTLDKAFQTCKDIGLVSRIEEGKNTLDEPKYTFYFHQTPENQMTLNI